MALVQDTDLAFYLRRDLTDDRDSYAARVLLDGASAAVTEYCGWHIAPRVTDTVTVDGSGTVLQRLPTLHLVDVLAVSEDGHSLNPARVDFSTNGLLEKRSGGSWTTRRRGVTATIVHGFDVTPGWLVTLICAVAARAYLTPIAVRQETAGSESLTYNTSDTAGSVALLPFEKKMLDRIRVPLGA